jgi:hypothetical protein
MAASAPTDDIERLREAIRALDAQVEELAQRASTDDERDHLRQIHFLLTSAKGHVGAVRVARDRR